MSHINCNTIFITTFIFIFCVWVNADYPQQQLFRRFEYKHSFRRPHLALSDGSIPFWVVQGDAIASPEQLRLVPSMRSRKGLAWNKRPMMSENFEVEVELKITGFGRVGADGMAIWYTKNIGSLGPVFGANDYWTGLAVFLDSYDNDAKQNNPFVSVMINDGTRSYDHQSDGANQIAGGCERDFRNQKFPVRVRIEYAHKILTISTKLNHADNKYEACARIENVFLPRNGYFGISSATGGLADDHDALEFSTISLLPETLTRVPIPQDEQQKYGEQYAKQQQEYEQDRKKFKEQHPDKVKEEEDDPSKYYEDPMSRELRYINDNQMSFHRALQQMESKFVQIIQQQQFHTGIMQEVQRLIGGGLQVTPPVGGQPPVARATDCEFQPHEKSEVLQSLRDLSLIVKEMRTYVNQIYANTHNIDQKVSGNPTQGQIASHDPQAQQLRAHLESIQNEVRQIRSNQQHQLTGGLPTCPNASCVTSTFLIGIILIQSIVILTFIFFRSKTEKAKFY